jgi:hypothetical protein
MKFKKTDLIKRAEQTFGFTDNFAHIAYLLDGQGLDFFDPQTNRFRDHNDIEVLGLSRAEFLAQAGAIRVSFSANVVALEFSEGGPPTHHDVEVIERFLEIYPSADVAVDVADEKGNVISSASGFGAARTIQDAIRRSSTAHAAREN